MFSVKPHLLGMRLFSVHIQALCMLICLQRSALRCLQPGLGRHEAAALRLQPHAQSIMLFFC